MDIRESKIDICKKAACQMRKNALEMSLKAGNNGSHLGGTLSMIEIMAVLYLGILKFDIASPTWELRDRFILSKGHGALALYTAMNQKGIISKEDLETFKANETYLTGHPSLNIEKGIEFSSGSLGQGLSLGIGTAIALKRKENHTSKVYVLLGDGECNEGSVWEAAMSASHYQLHNIVAIIDRNWLQYDGKTEEILKEEDFEKKWKAFGWEVKRVDGHKVEELYDAFQTKSEKPFVIIADTIKGKGVSFMENNPLWHHSRLSQKQYEQAMAEQEG